ncbi:hypothetical protein N7504_004254 [Penicillium tannophilum]|nr:hypothetical protein N7504_004254 [Penicillium tannophilum]
MSEAPREHFADRIIVDPRKSKSGSTPRNLKDVAESPVLVGQIHRLLDDGTKSELIIDVELLSAEWAFQFSIENESDAIRIKENTTELGMTVTQGSEISESVSASAGFAGWGFSAEINGSTETRTFTSVETQTLSRVVDTYTCPPHTSIFVYKRKFKFRCRTWFYDQVGNRWLESSTGKIEAVFANEITADRELIITEELKDHGKIANNPPSDLVLPKTGINIQKQPGAWFSLYLLIKQGYSWAN